MLPSSLFRNFTRTAVAVSLMTLGAAAFAQSTTTAPARLRGTVTRVAGDHVDLTLGNGATAVAMLNTETRYTSVSPATISDIKPDTYVGSAAITLPDGSSRALEVSIFPPGATPSEGHFPWDLGNDSTMTNGKATPRSTMTNGRVKAGGESAQMNGTIITVNYPNGEKQILVPDDAPVVRLGMGARSMLKAGAHVVLFMKKGDDGTQVVGNAAIGEGELVPPM